MVPDGNRIVANASDKWATGFESRQRQPSEPAWIILEAAVVRRGDGNCDLVDHAGDGGEDRAIDGFLRMSTAS